MREKRREPASQVVPLIDKLESKVAPFANNILPREGTSHAATCEQKRPKPQIA